MNTPHDRNTWRSGLRDCVGEDLWCCCSLKTLQGACCCVELNNHSRCRLHPGGCGPAILFAAPHVFLTPRGVFFQACSTKIISRISASPPRYTRACNSRADKVYVLLASFLERPIKVCSNGGRQPAVVGGGGSGLTKLNLADVTEIVEAEHEVAILVVGDEVPCR